MTFREVWRALRRYWYVVLVGGLAGGGIAAAAVLVPGDRFEATATLLVQPNAERVDFAAVEAVRFLLPSIAEQVETDAFADAVAAASGDVSSAGDVDLGAGFVPGSGVLRIKAKADTAGAAAVAANLAAAEVVARPLSDVVAITILDPASPPDSPAGPALVIVAVGGAVLGGILGVFVAVGLGALRDRSLDRRDLEDRLGVPVLAELPHDDGAIPATGAGDPAIERLRARLDLRAGTRSAITVTGATPGAGASTVTARLAAAYGAAGVRLVAVDCDVAQPALHTYLGLPNGQGLCDVGPDDLPDVFESSAVPSLTVIPAGQRRAYPPGAVEAAFRRVLAATPDRLVLADTPAVSAGDEAVELARAARSTIVVFDGRRGSLSEIDEAIEALRGGGVDLLGIVVNSGKLRPPRRQP